MGSDKKTAGSRAAGEQNRFIQKGIDKLAPFFEAGAGQLDSLIGGASVGGLDARLADLLSSSTFGSLVGERERAVQGQLGAGGLTRSGAGVEAMAAVPTELALQLEQMLTGRSSNLAGQGFQAGGAIANQLGQQGEALASGIVTDAAAQGSFLSQAASLGAGIFFSDKRLKENIVEIANVDGLSVVEWDWVSQTKGTVIEGCPNVGFIAQDVRDKYPEFVGEYAGWLFVDYENLMKKIQANHNDKMAREAA